MADDLDQRLRQLQEEQGAAQAITKWASKYAVANVRPVRHVTHVELKSPHVDLVESYFQRAVPAGLATPVVLLEGPGGLHVARLIDFSEVKIERPWGYTPPGLPIVPFWLRLRRDNKRLAAENQALADRVECVNSELLRAGTKGVELDVPTGTHTEGYVDYITCCQFDGRLYCASGTYGSWGERESMVKNCADRLAKASRKRTA